GALSDPGVDAHLRTGHARGIQSRAGAGLPDHAAGPRCARRRDPHHHPPRRARFHSRPLDQAGGGDAGAGGADPLTAADRRQGAPVMSDAPQRDPRNTRIMNRFALTERLVARLGHEEAVVAGIGNTNFDLWAARRRPQNFYMLGSMGLAVPIAL